MSDANASLPYNPVSRLGIIPTFICDIAPGVYGSGEVSNLVVVQSGTELQEDSIYNFTCNFSIGPYLLNPSNVRLVYSIHDDLADPVVLISQRIDYNNSDGIKWAFSGIFSTGPNTLYYGVQIIAYTQTGGDYTLRKPPLPNEIARTYFSKLSRRI